MHRFLTTPAAALLATAAAATAMEGIDLDINGDRFATLGEVRQILGVVTPSDFRSLD